MLFHFVHLPFLIAIDRDFKPQMKTGILMVKRRSGCVRAAGSVWNSPTVIQLLLFAVYIGPLSSFTLVDVTVED